MVCGADDIVFILDLCLCLSVLLDLFFLFLGRFCWFCGVHFIMNDLLYSLIGILLHWTVDLLCDVLVWLEVFYIYGFVFIISSLVILDSDDHMFGDLNIFRFILLVLIFVVYIMFLIVSPNVNSVLLGWDGLVLVSYLLVN